MFTYVVVPLLIFFSRIIDVSMGTIRIVFVSRNNKLLAPLLGFLEVLIWLIAMTQIMKNLTNVLCYIAYAGGFSIGTYIGLLIEEKLALGVITVRIILVKDNCKLKEQLAYNGYGVTIVDAEGVTGKVKLIYTVIKRKNLDDVISIIHSSAKKAFYSVEDSRTVNQGVFPRKSKKLTCNISNSSNKSKHSTPKRK